MWYLRALAVAAVAVPLVVGAGCVSQATYNRDVMAAQAKADAAQKQLDQAKKELKAAQDKQSAVSHVLADLKAAQKNAVDQKARANGLQAQLADAQKACDLVKTELRDAKAKAMTLDHTLNAQAALKAELKAAKEQLADTQAQLTAARNAIAEIAKQLPGAMPEKQPGM